MSKAKMFSLEEAQMLLPVLESLLRTAIAGKAEAVEIENELQALNHRIFQSGGMLPNIVSVAQRRSQRDKAVQRVTDAIGEIDAIGVQVKDLDIGLLDFPCVVEGETILLCWKMGESDITHWHGLEEGFTGRKPVDERIRKAKKKP